MRDKKKLTEELIRHLPDYAKVTTQEAINLWYYNLRAGGGMRLTKFGYETFTGLLDLKEYRYEVDPMVIDSRMIVMLDRRLQHPWYLVFEKKMPKTLIFFSSQEAMLANLYGGLKQFIDNYKN